MALGEYEKASKSLRFLLEASFKHGSTDEEIYVYDRLALCNFYLGSLDKC